MGHDYAGHAGSGEGAGVAHGSNPQICSLSTLVFVVWVATASLASAPRRRSTLRLDHEIPWADIDRVVGDWQPAQLVVGLPEGEGVAQRALLRAFVHSSSNAISCPSRPWTRR
jgi:hypothetical protein